MFVVQAWVKLYCPGWKVLWCRLVFCTSVSSNTRRLTTSTPRSMFSGTLLWRRLLFSSTLRMMPCAITRAWRRWWSSGGAAAKPRRARSGRSQFMQVICAHTLRIICPRWSTLCSLSTWCLWRPKCKFWRPSPVSLNIQVAWSAWFYCYIDILMLFVQVLLAKSHCFSNFFSLLKYLCD